MSLCSSRQSWKDIHICGCLPSVTWPFTAAQVTLVHLAADAIPLGLCITKQQVPQLLVRLGNCLVVSFLGFLEHLWHLLNLYLASWNVHRGQDGVLRLHSFLEILERLGLGEYPALLGQPLVLDYAKDRKDVCKVFLLVPPGLNRDTEVWCIWKLYLEQLGFFLGHDDINDKYVWDRRPVRQLLFLAFRILQPIKRLDGGTHFGVLPESGT